MKKLLLTSLIAVLASLSFAQDLSTQERRDLRQAYREFRMSQTQMVSLEDEVRALKKDAQARAQANKVNAAVAAHGFTDQEIKDLRQAYQDFQRDQTQVLSLEDEMKSLKKDQQARARQRQVNIAATK